MFKVRQAGARRSRVVSVESGGAQGKIHQSTAPTQVLSCVSALLLYNYKILENTGKLKIYD